MPTTPNTEVNQPPEVIDAPIEEGVETAGGDQPEVPPMEIPGRTDTPEHMPEKSIH